MTDVVGLRPHEIAGKWSKIKPLLKKVVKPSTGYTVDYVQVQLVAGRWHLWVVGDYKAVAVIEINQRPLYDVLWVWFLAGKDMKEWLDDLEAELVNAAEFYRCKAIEFFGRAGWRHHNKMWPGYKQTASIFRKEVDS